MISPEGAATPFGMTPRSKGYPVGATFNLGMSEYDSALVYMPLEEAQLFFDRGDKVDRLELRVVDPDKTQPVMRALRARLGSNVLISDWVGANASLVTALVVERNVMRLILLMIVAIATMNIISGLIMLVKNKGRDIAILRTMGATRGAIMRIFFLSGATIGALGTRRPDIWHSVLCVYRADPGLRQLGVPRQHLQRRGLFAVAHSRESGMAGSVRHRRVRAAVLFHRDAAAFVSRFAPRSRGGAAL